MQIIVFELSWGASDKWQVTLSKINGNGEVIAWDVTCIVTGKVGNMFHFNILHSEIFHLNWNVITVFRMMMFMNGILILRIQIKLVRSQRLSVRQSIHFYYYQIFCSILLTICFIPILISSIVSINHYDSLTGRKWFPTLAFFVVLKHVRAAAISAELVIFQLPRIDFVCFSNWRKNFTANLFYDDFIWFHVANNI